MPDDDATLERWYDAPPGAVFHAVTDPGLYARWYGPEGVTVPPDSVSIDLRPGGTWTSRMEFASGWSMTQAATVVEVVPDERVVTTEPAPDGSMVTLTIELHPQDGGTRLALRHGPFPESTGGTGGAEAGWAQSLAKLDDVLRG